MARFSPLTMLVGIVLLLGCGGHKPATGIIVKGKVTKGGAPITVPNMESKVGTVKIELFPVYTDPADQREAEGTLSEADGSFNIVGAGKGIKPGKYKLAIFADPGDGINQLGDRFTGENSPIEVEISEKDVGGTKDLGTLEVDTYK
jgi:hypothetical protein